MPSRRTRWTTAKPPVAARPRRPSRRRTRRSAVARQITPRRWGCHPAGAAAQGAAVHSGGAGVRETRCRRASHELDEIGALPAAMASPCRRGTTCRRDRTAEGLHRSSAGDRCPQDARARPPCAARAVAGQSAAPGVRPARRAVALRHAPATRNVATSCGMSSAPLAERRDDQSHQVEAVVRSGESCPVDLRAQVAVVAR